MAIDEELESTGSRPASPRQSRQQPQRHKLEVYNEVLHRLRKSKHPESNSPTFEDDLWAHFHRFPARYAMDVNVERAEEVLNHKRLLQEVQRTNRLAFDVRVVQLSAGLDEDPVNHSDSSSQTREDARCSPKLTCRPSIHPPPAFGSTMDLLSLDTPDGDSITNANERLFRPMHEIAFSTHDKPKLLSQITSLLAEIGLNIQEAHAFSTTDGFSLDVFVVDGWRSEDTAHLKEILQQEVDKIEDQAALKGANWPPVAENIKKEPLVDHVQIPYDGTDVWEIDISKLKFENKIASGSYGDLYRGTYCSQDVAIKILKPERVNNDMQHEFAQEVYIMRKVRHKHVVQFLGACTRLPNLCIITEFMSGGSVYDFLHKQKGGFKLPVLLRVAIDVAKGMNYLHQNNIIHRDLKTANLLMDENKVVKVADFGVARVKASSGVMTAETGTYRWMAPEVILHKPYDHKADVFSFGVVLWELLTGKIPYEYLTPLQAAVGVVQEGLRPTIPKDTHSKLSALLETCWQQDPSERPDFSQILKKLEVIAQEVGDRHADHHKGGLLSVLKRGH